MSAGLISIPHSCYIQFDGALTVKPKTVSRFLSVNCKCKLDTHGRMSAGS